MDTGILSDFTADRRLILLSLLAAAIGIISVWLAVGLLGLIAFFTNLFFFGRLSFAPASPADHTRGWLVLAIPVAGGLVVGVMARYGSERIRGHGIPEAIESILIGGSRVEPKLAVLKPVSAAVSIGSGGPLDAEGPIIMTGGASPSVVVAYPDEPLRAIACRMASTGLTRFPVVERGEERTVIGMISLTDLLHGRTRALDAERRRERLLSLRIAVPAAKDRP